MFWIAAGLLVVFACAFVLLPLLLVRREDALDVDRDQINVALYREREQDLDDDSLLNEARKNLLEDTESSSETEPTHGLTFGDRRSLVAVAVLVPLLAVLVYTDLGLGQGSIADVDVAESLASLSGDDPAAFDKFAARVEQRLAAHPDDGDMQYLLASIYSRLERYEQAAGVYAEMLERFPDDQNLLSRYAEVLFVADGRRMTPRAEAAVERALQANPVDLTMLEIRGIGALTAGNPDEALAFFNRALQTGVAGERARLIQMAIARIRQDTGDDTLPGGRAIQVSLTLDPEVSVPDTAVLFVYARAAEGPAAPLAVQRLAADQLPAEVRLDETMAMMPAMSLGNFDRVQVVARVSMTGEVAPAAGDIEASSEVLALGDEVLKVTLQLSEMIQ